MFSHSLVFYILCYFFSLIIAYYSILELSNFRGFWFRKKCCNKFKLRFGQFIRLIRFLNWFFILFTNSSSCQSRKLFLILFHRSARHFLLFPDFLEFHLKLITWHIMPLVRRFLFLAPNLSCTEGGQIHVVSTNLEIVSGWVGMPNLKLYPLRRGELGEVNL